MSQDPYLWLEQIDSPEALAWVEAQNAISVSQLKALPTFAPIQERIIDSLNSSEKIPFVSVQNGWLYNFWRDQNHVRGIWRRTTLESYKTPNPDWQLLLDVDKLAAQEGKNWVLQQTKLEPTQGLCALIGLSDGGKDAAEVREFNLETCEFIQDGFYLENAKSRVTWFDQNTLYVGTDFGEGSLTNSGYPRIVKCWTRGQNLAEAVTVFEGQPEDVWAYAVRGHEAPHHVFFERGLDFFTNEFYWLRQNNLQKLEKPNSASASIFGDWLLLELREAWHGFSQGALIAANFEAAFYGNAQWTALFTPDEYSALAGFILTKNTLVLNVLRNVQNQLVRVVFDGEKWQSQVLETPENATLYIWAYDRDSSDEYWMQATGFTMPNKLLLGGEVLKSMPAFFDADGLAVQQCWATSQDGTRIPYFLIARHDFERNGKNPTVLYGYGGFKVSELPYYSTGAGIGWLERGGVYVVANIRGGGEFGPRWHRAALRENRQLAYDDFIAIAEDLIAQGVTSPKHLGIRGGAATAAY